MLCWEWKTTFRYVFMLIHHAYVPIRSAVPLLTLDWLPTIFCCRDMNPFSYHQHKLQSIYIYPLTTIQSSIFLQYHRVALSMKFNQISFLRILCPANHIQIQISHPLSEPLSRCQVLCLLGKLFIITHYRMQRLSIRVYWIIWLIQNFQSPVVSPKISLATYPVLSQQIFQMYFSSLFCWTMSALRLII